MSSVTVFRKTFGSNNILTVEIGSNCPRGGIVAMGEEPSSACVMKPPPTWNAGLMAVRLAPWIQSKSF